MNKLFLGFLLGMLSLAGRCQSLFLHIQPGLTGYGGDLSEKAINTKLLSPAASAGLSFETGPHFAFNASWMYGHIKGDDKYSTTRAFRNLKFDSDIREYTFMAQYNFLNRNLYKISPYVTTGIAVFHFNPYLEIGIQKYYLHDYRTEGQGLYQGVQPYKLTQLSIPIGGGFEWTADNDVRIGVVAIFRKTFTDYLDDVSQSYAPKQLLLDAFGQKSVDLAYRAGLLPNGNRDYPDAGTPRGNPNNKDSYFFIGCSLKLRFKHTIGAIIEREGNNDPYKVRLDCPRF